MNRLSRHLFIQRTCELLNQRGRVDLSLADLLDSCGAQKGSLYHFFPSGKDELLVASVEHMSACALNHIGQCLTEEASVADAVFRQASELATWLDKPDRSFAIPFTAIAAITGAQNQAVQSACRTAVQRIELAFADQLKVDGLPKKDARAVAAFIVSSVEGCLLCARMTQTGEPLRNAAGQLRTLISHKVSCAEETRRTRR